MKNQRSIFQRGILFFLIFILLNVPQSTQAAVSKVAQARIRAEEMVFVRQQLLSRFFEAGKLKSFLPFEYELWDVYDLPNIPFRESFEKAVALGPIEQRRKFAETGPNVFVPAFFSPRSLLQVQIAVQHLAPIEGLGPTLKHRMEDLQNTLKRMNSVEELLVGISDPGYPKDLKRSLLKHKVLYNLSGGGALSLSHMAWNDPSGPWFGGVLFAAFVAAIEYRSTSLNTQIIREVQDVFEQIFRISEEIEAQLNGLRLWSDPILNHLRSQFRRINDQSSIFRERLKQTNQEFRSKKGIRRHWTIAKQNIGRLTFNSSTEREQELHNMSLLATDAFINIREISYLMVLRQAATEIFEIWKGSARWPKLFSRNLFLDRLDTPFVELKDNELEGRNRVVFQFGHKGNSRPLVLNTDNPQKGTALYDEISGIIGLAQLGLPTNKPTRIPRFMLYPVRLSGTTVSEELISAIEHDAYGTRKAMEGHEIPGYLYSRDGRHELKIPTLFLIDASDMSISSLFDPKEGKALYDLLTGVNRKNKMPVYSIVITSGL